MKMDDLKIEKYDIKDKMVLVRDADITEQQMGYLSQQLKKQGGAREVIYVFGDIKIEALSDEDLNDMGLCRVVKKE